MDLRNQVGRLPARGGEKSKGAVTVYSRRRNILNEKFGYIADALKDLPDDTVLDGELWL